MLVLVLIIQIFTLILFILTYAQVSDLDKRLRHFRRKILGIKRPGKIPRSKTKNLVFIDMDSVPNRKKKIDD